MLFFLIQEIRSMRKYACDKPLPSIQGCKILTRLLKVVARGKYNFPCSIVVTSSLIPFHGKCVADGEIRRIYETDIQNTFSFMRHENSSRGNVHIFTNDKNLPELIVPVQARSRIGRKCSGSV